MMESKVVGAKLQKKGEKPEKQEGQLAVPSTPEKETWTKSETCFECVNLSVSLYYEMQGSGTKPPKTSGEEAPETRRATSSTLHT